MRRLSGVLLRKCANERSSDRLARPISVHVHYVCRICAQACVCVCAAVSVYLCDSFDTCIENASFRLTSAQYPILCEHGNLFFIVHVTQIINILLTCHSQAMAVKCASSPLSMHAGDRVKIDAENLHNHQLIMSTDNKWSDRCTIITDSNVFAPMCLMRWLTVG